MAGAKTKEEARVLMEDRLDPWSAFEGWWIVGPPLKIHCFDCPNAKQIEGSSYVWISARSGRALCAEHGDVEVAKLAEAKVEAQRKIAASPDPMREREIIARERLADAVERFTKTFEAMSVAVTRYVRHLTKQQ